MNDLFDDPGDLGFFDLHEEDIEPEEFDNPFYEPFPGEEEQS
jgi:hypothetical protein